MEVGALLKDEKDVEESRRQSKNFPKSDYCCMLEKYLRTWFVDENCVEDVICWNLKKSS